MSRPLVIVESPTKRDTIQRFLGPNYMVEACVGHVRDLPQGAADLPEEAKKKGYDPDFAVHFGEDFKPWYVLTDKARRNMPELRRRLKEASELVLATDEDREGESISWHLLEELRPKVPVKRMVFHEITAEAVRYALAHPRQLDDDLVQAQETRRVLDRLVGYGISPLLWRKIKGARSAGRVQSPAIRLLVERERERMAFRASDWWDVEASIAVQSGEFHAGIEAVDGRRVARGRDFDETTGRLSDPALVCLDERAATSVAARFLHRQGTVTEVDEKPWRERPFPPFTTSTLQMEANRKLRWTAKHTMKVAQSLYEQGWITYMRTDSVALSEQAIAAARTVIGQQYGADYLPAHPRRYKSHAKNAQEAHEAIRPAGHAFRPIEEARAQLAHEPARLYELIWKRTVASEMEDAHGTQVSVKLDLAAPADATCPASVARFGASGRTIRFPGFRRAYVEGSDDPEAELAERERILPPLRVGDAVKARRLSPKGHTTQPPPRITEATLVKELERRGIGRPSTYADIIEKILNVGYAFKRGTALVPTHLALLVVGFLEKELGELVSYDFTARVEDDLDRIALGRAKRSAFLAGFYLGDRGLRTRLELALKSDAKELYRLPLAGEHPPDLCVRVGQFGPYVTNGHDQKATVPRGMAPDEVTLAWARAALVAKAEGPATLGADPKGTPVYLMNGKYGPYVQLGEGKGKEKPRRASLLPGMTVDGLTLPDALSLLSLPRVLGADPKGVEISASNGRYGPFLKRGDDTRSLPEGTSPLHLTLAQALEILATPRAGGRAVRGRPQALGQLGADPVSGGIITLMDGRFGAYVTDGTTNATLPRGRAADGVTLDEAAELLARRRDAVPSTRGRRFGRGARAAAGRKAKEPGSKKSAKTKG